jgi:hypothetical protein
MTVLKEEINWSLRETSPRRLLKDVSFIWKIVQRKILLLIKLADIVQW